MAIKHIGPGEDFHFPSEFGFTGSAQGRHDARNLPNKAADNEYGDGSYTQSKPYGGAQSVPELRKARGGQVGADWEADRAAEAHIRPAQPSQRPPVGPKAPGKKGGGRIRRAMGGTVDAEYEPKMVTTEGDVTEPNANIRRGGHPHAYAGGGPVRRALGGPAMPGVNPGNQAGSGLGNATITMPVRDMAQAAGKMMATGAAMGARGALAGAAQRAQAALRGPGTPSTAGAPAVPVAQQGIPAMKKGGHLTAKQRHALPSSDFALPGERYPINNPNHARNALARVAQHGSEAEQRTVRAAVHRKYPGIGQKKG
jgi:hypothetical protein